MDCAFFLTPPGSREVAACGSILQRKILIVRVVLATLASPVFDFNLINMYLESKSCNHAMLLTRIPRFFRCVTKDCF